MRFLAALAVAVCVTASAASASLEQLGREPLTWAPPSLTDPVTIEVTNANRRLFLDDARDYRLVVAEPLQRELWIDGGRNVVVVGGQVTISELGSSSPYQDNTAVKIRNGDPAGAVHVEGLRIDGRYVADGVAVATRRDVQIQNVRVERAHDDIKGAHADCVQVQAGVGQLRIDRFSCSTQRQGIFLGDRDGPIERVDLRRVNVYGASGKHLLFQERPAYPVALSRVWLGTAPGYAPWAPFGFWVFPQKDGRTVAGGFDKKRRAVVSRDGKRLWFVGSRINGVIRKGAPPTGDFVSPGAAGMSYASPGYAAGRGPS